MNRMKKLFIISLILILYAKVGVAQLLAFTECRVYGGSKNIIFVSNTSPGTARINMNDVQSNLPAPSVGVVRFTLYDFPRDNLLGIEIALKTANGVLKISGDDTQAGVPLQRRVSNYRNSRDKEIVTWPAIMGFRTTGGRPAESRILTTCKTDYRNVPVTPEHIGAVMTTDEFNAIFASDD